ncbi:hypothetical protein AB4Y87_25335 [Paenarthrobacter sp. RAF54_2]|uniref:hypothetical protein n=1 Tax=Paenarthrobacter sp. RAF54_2 TaxID=3233061 RepID=UPI003F9D07D5
MGWLSNSGSSSGIIASQVTTHATRAGSPLLGRDSILLAEQRDHFGGASAEVHLRELPAISPSYPRPDLHALTASVGEDPARDVFDQPDAEAVHVQFDRRTPCRRAQLRGGDRA